MADPVAGQSPSSVLTPVAAESTVAPSTDVASTPVDAAASPAAPSWFDGLPEGLKGAPSLQAFKGKDIKDVVESFVNAEKLVGGSLRLPSDKDTPAERAAKLDRVFTQLGRPSKPEEYKLTPPGEDTGVKWDAAQAEQFKALAHRIGLNQAQVDELSAYDTQRQMGGKVDSTAAYNECMETLGKDWGAGKNAMLGLSRRTAATYFDKDTIAAIDSTGLSNNPNFVKAIARMGKELMEEGLIVGAREGMGEDGGLTAIQAEYNAIMGDNKGAYWDSSNPNHDAAVLRAESLQRAMLELAPSAR